ncbi:MAG TPA: sigma-70 family RNA polymerase sigma factor [Polyangiaceae bacterium]|nr:sigma-70 family RNA polymerase sigma factor [Polyangiaceae bacterium]
MAAFGTAAESGSIAGAGEVADARPTFADVYEAYFPFVWRSARRLGTPAPSVDDVVQEVFVVVHRRLARFEGRSSLKTWLFGIVLNVVRAHRRALRAGHPDAPAARGHADPDTLSDRAAGPHECVTRAEAARLVDRLLESLDEDKRAVFVLAELEQMSAPEIAAALVVPVNTVYSRLRLARQEFAAAAARYRARDEWRTR